MHLLTTHRRLLAILLCGAVMQVAPIQAMQVPPVSTEPDQSIPDTAILRADIAYLASRELDGRATGSRGNAMAAEFVARRYHSLDLTGAFTESGCAPGSPCPPAYFQLFELPPSVANRYGLAGVTGVNVAAVIVGSDSLLRHEYVLLGAHYDHIGHWTWVAMDPTQGGVLHPGADDNASGTAALMLLARRLARNPPRRSILLVNFGAEEVGLVGSRMFAEHPAVPLDSVTAMLNFDMVGRLRKSLDIQALEGSSKLRTILDSIPPEPGLKVSRTDHDDGNSDQSAFNFYGVPVAEFFTGMHGDYHRATDTADKINVPGIEQIVDYAENLVRYLGDRDTMLPRAHRKH